MTHLRTRIRTHTRTHTATVKQYEADETET